MYILINYEYFNNLNRDEYYGGICTSPYPYQSMREFSVKTDTSSNKTHGDEFICHLYLKQTHPKRLL